MSWILVGAQVRRVRGLAGVSTALALVLLLAGSGTALARSVPIGQGRTIYLQCRGHGRPTVVLISGLGDRADIWGNAALTGPHADQPRAHPGPAVLPATARSTRVCAYDRPNTGTGTAPSRSTPVRQPVSARHGARDLNALLKSARLPGPYILVGHSFGGSIARVYGSEHPRNVAGLVLVDALSEGLGRKLTPKQLTIFEELNAPAKGVAETEDLNVPAIFAQLRRAKPTRSPTIILTADHTPLPAEAIASGQLPPAVTPAFADALWRAQIFAQNALANHYPWARHITHTNSTHYIQILRPRLVINAIHSVIKQIRRSRHPADACRRR